MLFGEPIKNLVFNPAALTKEYLSIKIFSYPAPVRLYILIRFIPFLLLATFPNVEKPLETSADKETRVTAKNRSFQSNTPKKGQAEKASKYHYEILNF